MRCRLVFLFVLAQGIAVPGFSQTLEFTSVPEGYLPGSIALPDSFAGALAIDPNNENVLYASLGAFGDNDVARILLDSGSVEMVADGPFGNVAGIAVLSATQLVLVDNGFAAGGPPDQTILLAQDLDGDGDFEEAGEITELITPILTGFFGFSGAQAEVVPPGNPQGLPSGSVVIQTADGGGGGELLVVTDPLGTPAFRPLGDSFFTGFDFNGGVEFDNEGRLIVASAIVVDPTAFTIAGRVYGLDNLDGNEQIDETEFGVIVPTSTLPSGISDLALDGDDDGFCTSGGDLKTFAIPADVLVGSSTPTTFATFNTTFVSGLAMSSQVRPFEPFSGPRGSTLIIGGGFSETNLLTLKPLASADLNGDGAINGDDLVLFSEQWYGEPTP